MTRILLPSIQPCSRPAHCAGRLVVALLACALFFFGPLASAATVPAADGLYATFKTNRGDFVAQLDFDKVPMTVANFVGLAEGSRSWIDFKTGAVTQRPFYNGITFHRVITGFMIQGGSPNGQGTDGPGYQFSDEFHPQLRHSGEGILSMANSGPDSNGSQFFITLGATSHLDNKHSVFGRIVDGMSVVTTVGNFPTPQPPASLTTIEKVEITRVGGAANAFDETAWSLPVVKPVEATLVQKPPGFALRFNRNAFTQYYPFHTAQLAQWAQLASFRFVQSPIQEDLDVSATTTGQRQRFYRVARSEYTPVPASVQGKSITLNLAASNQRLVLNITAPPRATYDLQAPLGTYSLDGGAAKSIGAYLWQQDLHRGQILLLLEGVGQLNFNFKFRVDGNGTFTGGPPDLPDGPFPYYGAFTTSNVAP